MREEKIKSKDYSTSERPETRTKQFFDIMRHRFVELLKLSLLQAVFNMPLIVSIVLFHILSKTATSINALMTIFKGSANDGGICHYCRPADCSNEDWSEVQVLGGLGGRAASELFFGVPDRGSSKDLMQVTRILNGDIESGAIPGSPLAKMLPGRGSEDYKHRIERVAETEMAKRYQLVKEILTANREFVEKLADAIAISEYLVASDIQEIREACGIVKLPHWHRQLIG